MSINAIGTPQVDIFSNYKNGFANTSGKTANASKNASTNAGGTPVDMDTFAFTPEYLASLVNKENKTIGLLGDGDFDVFYVPDQIAKKMPQISELPRATLGDLVNGTLNNENSMTTTEMSNAFGSVSEAWAEYRKVLNDFGIKHNNQASMAKFFNDSTLMDAVNAKFDKIV